MHRWIMYVWEAIPGNDSTDPMRVESLAAARDAFEQYAMDMNTDFIVATLYPHSDEAWETAEEFRGVGNPFDYPSKTIHYGARGAVLIEAA